MLSLRTSRRFCHVATAVVVVRSDCAAAAVSKSVKALEEPALVKLKAERDPEKLFELFKASAHNR